MKKFLIILLLTAYAGVQAQDDLSFFRLDTLHSKIYWRCDKHKGTVKFLDGGLVLEKDAVLAGKFIIDVRTLKDSDMSTKKYGTAVLILENTLKNEFLEVEKYPLAVFDLQEVKHLQGNEYELTGDLTLHGTTICLSFKATVDFESDVIKLKSEKFTIDRTDWGIYRMSPKRPYSDDENGWTVPDKVEIKIDLILKKE